MRFFIARFVRVLFLCTVLGFVTAPVPAGATTVLSPLEVSNPHLVAHEKGGTRLNARDSVIICANHQVGAAVVGPPECLTIRNESDVDYFIPWRTPQEYDAFLKALESGSMEGLSLTDHCLPRGDVPVCGSILIKQLGARPAGYIAEEIPYYGAQDDVFGPVNASLELNDPTINYKTTFVCDKKEWLQTHASGSCVPMDGACSGMSEIVANEGGWPADQNNLCKEGSLIENLAQTFTAGVPTGWSWVCKGTPGRGSASCTATMIKPVSGLCGAVDGQSLDEPPSSDKLCAQGVPSTAIFSKTDLVWKWTCTGQLNGPSNTVSCQASNAKPPENAKCNWIGNNYVMDLPHTKSIRGQTGRCDKGSIYNPETGLEEYTDPVLFDSDPPYNWTWTCFGKNGGTHASCKTILRLDGVCRYGTDINYGYPTIITDWSKRPGAPNRPDACRLVGDMAANGIKRIDPPISFEEETGKLSWVCPGTLGGKDTNCSIKYIPDNQKMTCSSLSGKPQESLYDPITKRFLLCIDGSCGFPPEDKKDRLCNNGNLIRFSVYNVGWQWTCRDPLGLWGDAWCQAPVANPSKDGKCGAASGVGVLSPDTANLCAYPTEQPDYALDNNNYVWKCAGTNGGKTVDCFAPSLVKADAICGAASGTYIPDVPNKQLCDKGQPSEMTSSVSSGKDVFKWICEGINGGKSANCLAYKCQACTGSLGQALNGSVNAEVVRYGCTLSGGLNWSSKSSRLKSSGSSLFGVISGLGTLKSEPLSLSAAQDEVCPPCAVSPDGTIGGVFTPATASGSCGAVEQNMLGQPYNILSLTAQ